MPISRIKSDGINDASITTAKLADSAVNSAKIGVDVIAAEDLAANSVTVSEISNGAVTSAKLDTNIDIAGTLDVTGTLTADSNLLIDSSGKLGIGQSSPATPLHINGIPGTSTLRLDAGGTLSGSRRNWAISGEKYVAGALSIEYGSTEGAAPSNAAMTIDSSGNVGIGTTSPATRLSIGDSTVNSENVMTFGKRVTSAQSNLPVIGHTSHDGTASDLGICATSSGGNVIFYTGNDAAGFGTGSNTERMRITALGNLLLNRTTELDTSMIAISQPSGKNVISIQAPDTNSYMALQLYNSSGSRVGYIQYSNTATTYSTSSDYRLKENVTADWDATTRLKQLNPVRFNFIADTDTTVDGFLAHEVQDIVPEAITGTHNEVDDDGNPVYQGIDQSKLVPLLVKTIQELEARITALEAN